MIEMTADIRGLTRELRRIRRKSVPFALKRATDDVARQVAGTKGLLQKEWNRTFNERRRTFPGVFIRVRRAFVSRGRVTKPSRVISTGPAATEEILLDQIKGRTRRPKRSRALLIPNRVRGRKPRKSPRRYRAGKYLFQAQRGKNKYVGALESSVQIPRRFDLEKVVRQAQRQLPAALRRSLQSELAKARSRGG